MTKLSVEFEKLNKELSTTIRSFEKLWAESYSLLDTSLPAEVTSTLSSLTEQVNQLVNELPEGLTKGLSKLLSGVNAGVNATSLGSVLGDLQGLVGESPLLQAGLAGVLATGTFSFANSSLGSGLNTVVIEGCFGSGINVGCIASGALDALGSLKNLEGLLSSLGGDLNQTIGAVFSNLGNPQALLGQLSAQVLPQVMSMATSIVESFGSGIASTLGSLASSAQALGSVLEGLPNMINSIAGSVEGLMGSLSKSLSGITGSLDGLLSGLGGVFDGLLGGLNLGGMFDALDISGLLGGFDFGGGLDIAICSGCF